MHRLLFLCTGNYYRSRFAEFLFRHLATQHQVPWEVDSRGLALCAANEGPLSRFTIDACQRMGIEYEPLRMPIALELSDLENADRTIAVKETEHRPLLQRLFPQWEDRVEYWEVHDLDVAPSHEALPKLQEHVKRLVSSLRETQHRTDR